MINRTIIYSFILILSLPVYSAPSASANAEIEYLFTYLKNSGCQFNRNGEWYSAVEAVAHLQKKYAYLLKKDMITTTESFIERAATQSSMSGKAYLVQCSGTQAVESAIWFKAELVKYRSEKSAASKP